MKTTIFSAFKAIATVALICTIGVTKSKAQNGPPAGSAYIIQNNTTCTFNVKIKEADGTTTCPTCDFYAITVVPGPNTFFLSPSFACTSGLNLCDLRVEITTVNGTPLPTPLQVSYPQQVNSITCPSCGTCNGGTYSMIWGITQTDIN